MKFRSSTTLFLSLLILSVSIFIAESGSNFECVYTIYIQTGSITKAGTDSKISARLSTSDGYGFEITNLVSWGGLMGLGHNYFERGNLDIFSGRGPCLEEPLCALNLTSDGSGSHAGWYCNFFEITSVGLNTPCSTQRFTIKQWLDTDAPPKKLYAYRNNCPKNSDGNGNGNGKFNGVIKSIV